MVWVMKPTDQTVSALSRATTASTLPITINPHANLPINSFDDRNRATKALVREDGGVCNYMVLEGSIGSVMSAATSSARVNGSCAEAVEDLMRRLEADGSNAPIAAPTDGVRTYRRDGYSANQSGGGA